MAGHLLNKVRGTSEENYLENTCNRRPCSTWGSLFGRLSPRKPRMATLALAPVPGLYRYMLYSKLYPAVEYVAESDRKVEFEAPPPTRDNRLLVNLIQISGDLKKNLRRSEKNKTGLDWTGLDWTGLDWTGLD